MGDVKPYLWWWRLEFKDLARKSFRVFKTLISQGTISWNFPMPCLGLQNPNQEMVNQMNLVAWLCIHDPSIFTHYQYAWPNLSLSIGLGPKSWCCSGDWGYSYGLGHLNNQTSCASSHLLFMPLVHGYYIKTLTLWSHFMALFTYIISHPSHKKNNLETNFKPFC